MVKRTLASPFGKGARLAAMMSALPPRRSPACDTHPVPSSTPLLTLLLPGLEGTGWMFSRFIAASTGALELRVLAYPPDRFLGYEALEELVRRQLPPTRPFALLGESFGGPLALRVGSANHPNLVGVVLASSFHRDPAPPWLKSLRPLLPAFFNLPLPAHAVRLLLAGPGASPELVREIQSAVGAVKGSVMAGRAREALSFDATPALLRLEKPLLFITGAEDRLLRPHLADEIRRLRPDAETAVLRAPHLALQQQPEEAMRMVEDFLRRAAPEHVPAAPALHASA